MRRLTARCSLAARDTVGCHDTPTQSTSNRALGGTFGVVATGGTTISSRRLCIRTPGARGDGSGVVGVRRRGIGMAGPTLAPCASSGGAGDASLFVFEPVEIEKPTTDYRTYRTARFPNRMQVVTVSDPKCDKSAAALSVGVGSLHDPKEIQGLAHFCEHMLFLGTAKYPKEDEYNSFLARHGGFSNAYTAETCTNYFFGVKPEAFDGALDRFAQFFAAPLFTESATDRELQAVDSEHSKNLQADGWRLSQLMRESACPEHPFHHFMTGNSKTLCEIPKEKGIDVRSALLDFHSRYYSANLMRLVLVGREDPDELMELAYKHFSRVVDSDAYAPKDAAIGGGIDKSFPPDRLGRFVRVVPVSDIRSLRFEFFLPSEKAEWRSLPSNYVSHFIGHEGQGSLLAALKRRGLATELSAGGGLDEAGIYVFTVSIQLTETGEAEVATVGEFLFAYMDLIRESGPQLSVWKELQQLTNMGFQFRSLADSVSTASGLAHSLQDNEPRFALSARSKLWDYEPDKITRLLNSLTCDRLRAVLSAKSHASVCLSEEPWYGTKYCDVALAPELRSHWENADVSFARLKDLALPARNPFVPQNLELKPTEVVPKVPTRLFFADPFVVAYFRKDEEFKLPKAVCAFQLYCPFASTSVKSRMLAELWCMAVREELSEFAYDAQVAGLAYSLVATPSGMTLSVGGYTDKLPTLLSVVAGKMAAMSEISEQAYGIAKVICERGLLNATLRTPPYQQAYVHEHLLLSSPAHSFEERLNIVRALPGPEALKGVNRQLLDNCHIECILQGDLLADEARELVSSFTSPLKILRPLSALPPVGSAKLPAGVTLLERPGTNAEERNGGTLLTLQVGESTLATRCLCLLAAQVLSQRFFDELRTKQQLGYIVSAAPFGDRHGYCGLHFVVQSERPPLEVAGRVSAWLETALETLQQIAAEDFGQYRAALIAQLRERPKSLGEEFGRNWNEICCRSFNFDEAETKARFLESLQVNDLRRFASEQIRGCPTLCVLVAAGSSASGVEGESGPPDQASLEAKLGFQITRRLDSPEAVANTRQAATWRWRPDSVSPPSDAESQAYASRL